MGASSEPAAPHTTVASVDDLTTRELDVLRLITNGRSNQEIADALYLGVNTVKTYIRTCYRRLGVQTRTQAVLWGVHHGLLEGYDVRPRRAEHPSLRAV